MALTGKIEFMGRTMSDAEEAVREALRRMTDGFSSGYDRNDSGNFSFEVYGEEEESGD